MDNLFSFKELRYKKPVLNTHFTKEDVFEINLPDTEPDAGRAVAAFALPLMRSKDAESGRMTVSGLSEVTVLFSPENGEGVRKVSVTREFSAFQDAPELDISSLLVADAAVSLCEARLLNSRKLQVRLELLFSFKAYDSETISLPDAMNSESVETLVSTAGVTLPAAVGEKTFTVTDSLSIPSANELLGSCVTFKIEDVRAVGSKAVVRGNALVRAVYISREKTVGTATLASPFSAKPNAKSNIGCVTYSPVL